MEDAQSWLENAADDVENSGTNKYWAKARTLWETLPSRGELRGSGLTERQKKFSINIISYKHVKLRLSLSSYRE